MSKTYGSIIYNNVHDLIMRGRAFKK